MSEFPFPRPAFTTSGKTSRYWPCATQPPWLQILRKSRSGSSSGTSRANCRLFGSGMHALSEVKSRFHHHSSSVHTPLFRRWCRYISQNTTTDDEGADGSDGGEVDQLVTPSGMDVGLASDEFAGDDGGRDADDRSAGHEQASKQESAPTRPVAGVISSTGAADSTGQRSGQYENPSP